MNNGYKNSRGIYYHKASYTYVTQIILFRIFKQLTTLLFSESIEFVIYKCRYMQV